MTPLLADRLHGALYFLGRFRKMFRNLFAHVFPFSLATFGNNRVTPGGGSIPLYNLYRYVPPYWVGFLPRFGKKTGQHFAPFGLESGMVFGETTGVYEGIYRFNSK